LLQFFDSLDTLNTKFMEAESDKNALKDKNERLMKEIEELKNISIG
jgi:hypothetical protein